MPHPHNIDYYIGHMEEESLADALADFEDPLEGRSIDLLAPDGMEDEFSEDELRSDFDDY
ncbi:MAG: hypothetical protein P8182_07000 [Deltaproteobacteria bacterium]